MDKNAAIYAPSIVPNFGMVSPLPVTVPAALEAVAGHYQRQGARIERGFLMLPLNVSHLSYDAALFDVVEARPELKDHVLFIDRGVHRPYDDVVWKIEEHGKELAEAVYLERNEKRKPTRIVITSPVRGKDPEDARQIVCGDVSVQGRKGVFVLCPVIETTPRQTAPHDKRYIVQTNDMALENTDFFCKRLHIPLTGGNSALWTSRTARRESVHAGYNL